MNSTEVKRIAELARLEFTDEQIESFTREFEKIVQYISVIEQTDMTGVEPMATVSDQPVIPRTDVAGESLPTADALSNAPKKNEAFFKVPKVLG